MEDEVIIDVSGLKRVFKVNKRDESGLIMALRSLVVREYKSIEAVSGISFKIRRGEIRGLIGPNGAGKSTTIKILSGVLFPTAGQVKVLGVTPWLERDVYVRQIGVVFGQKSQLWWDLPPIDTFSLHKKMYKIPEQVFRDNLDYFKETLSIGDVITRPTRQLSLGERMKCEFACALLHGPKLVFLDEPTIGLDILSKEVIRNFIKQTNREKKTTFILTTHDLSDIKDLCQNIIVINKGKLIYDGTLDNIKTLISSKKFMEIKFSKPVPKEALNQFKLVAYNPWSIKIEIEIDLGAEMISNELTQIIATLPVADINISDINIEDVIKQLYCA